MLRCVKTPTCETVICHWFPTMPQHLSWTLWYTSATRLRVDILSCSVRRSVTVVLSGGEIKRWLSFLFRWRLKSTLCWSVWSCFCLKRSSQFGGKGLLIYSKEDNIPPKPSAHLTKTNIPVMTCCMQPAQPPCFTFWRLWTSTNLLNSFKLCFCLSSLEG